MGTACTTVIVIVIKGQERATIQLCINNDITNNLSYTPLDADLTGTKIKGVF